MTFVVGSMTGVPTMPTVGSMSPHDSFEEGTGGPAFLTHTTAPVVASSAYTSLPTVAAYTRVPSTRGWLHSGASSCGDCHAKAGVSGVAPSGSNPERTESR